MSPIEVESLRKRLNLTQREFAEKIGVTAATVSRLEHGTRKPGGAVLMLLQNLAKSGGGR